jgi:hypothetical protein
MAQVAPPAPTSAVEWDNLGFKWIDTNGHVKYIFKDGKWDQGEFVRDSYIKMHVCAPALNYGQEVCFSRTLSLSLDPMFTSTKSSALGRPLLSHHKKSDGKDIYD